MNRRNFLKLLGITPIAPGVLKAIPHKEPKELTVDAAREHCRKTISTDIPKDAYGWVRVGGVYPIASSSMEIPDGFSVVEVSFDIPDDEPEQ